MKIERKDITITIENTMLELSLAYYVDSMECVIDEEAKKLHPKAPLQYVDKFVLAPAAPHGSFDLIADQIKMALLKRHHDGVARVHESAVYYLPDGSRYFLREGEISWRIIRKVSSMSGLERQGVLV